MCGIITGQVQDSIGVGQFINGDYLHTRLQRALLQSPQNAAAYSAVAINRQSNQSRIQFSRSARLQQRPQHCPP